jgi:hypothetical protein
MINPPQVLPEEPTAVTPHGGFCGGKSQQWLRYPTKPHASICGGGAGQLAPLPDQVHCDEGAAIHIGPEPCTGIREDVGEASAGERIGQPLSRENKIVPGADVLINAEGNMDGGIIASARPTRRGRRPWHVWQLFAREPGGLGFDLRLDTAGPHREDEES